MEEPKTVPESEKAVCKANDLHTFVIALLTSIIVVGLYHFILGAYKIYFPETEASYFCEEVDEEAVEGEQAKEARPEKEHFKGKKPGKPPKFDKDGKPRRFGKDGKPPKFGKDGKPPKFGKDGKPRKFGKGKKTAPAQEKADAPAAEKAPEKADASAAEKAQEKAPAEQAK